MSGGGDAREALIAAAREMSRLGLSPGRSGNLSCRHGAGLLVTPSGMDYETLEPADIVVLDPAGRVIEGGRRPSSEWRFHAALYGARADIGAVVHCHSRHATALACTGRSIPAFHYMVAAAGGGDIRCAPYAVFGSQALADAAVAAMEGRRACLLANHGQIAAGGDLSSALELAREVEELAAQYCHVLAIGGGRVLGETEMASVLARFADYGQRDD